jgi:hypothetical protein
MRQAHFGACRLVSAIAVIALVVLALVAAPAGANPAPATISFVGTASLVTNPGAVEVTLHYSCLPPSPGFIAVDLDEAGLPGGAAADATCDGQNHSVTVTVDGVFTRGTAAGRADVTNNSGGATASTSATVAIK